jgi:GAF domain-containing protein
MTELDPETARTQLYELKERDATFEEKADEALALGERFLDVENGHVARIDHERAFWQTIASTDDADGRFPPGDVYDLSVTFCRHAVESNATVAFHDASEAGWEADRAFEEHQLHCSHGTPIMLRGAVYGTVCFVSADPRDERFSAAETMFAELLAVVLEKELQTQLLEVELRRLEAFGDVLSHDLRNPLKGLSRERPERERRRRPRRGDEGTRSNGRDHRGRVATRTPGERVGGDRNRDPRVPRSDGVAVRGDRRRRPRGGA